MSKAEYILCAAIWYKEDFAKECPHRPPNVDEGVVLCGYRHPNIIAQMSALTGRRTPTIEHVQGFLTSTGRFVDRQDGWNIAASAGQIPLEGNTAQELWSEDLY